MTSAKNQQSRYLIQEESGVPITLGKKIGGGGAGTVYEIQGNKDEVVKIWHDDQVPKDAGERLRYLIGNPVTPEPSDNWKIAWPKRIVRKIDKSVAGYVMDRMGQGSAPIYGFYNATVAPNTAEKQGRREISIAIRVKIAKNLALGYEAVHKKGYVIGDINPNNAEADQVNDVILWDCDSYGFTDPNTKRRYDNNQGMPDFQAPEAQDDYSNRTQESDWFALAVLIFQLLTGFHPYMPTKGSNVDNIGDKIKNGLFPPINHALGAPHGYKVAWNALTDEQKQLASRCFSPEYYKDYKRKRPQPQDWIKALNKLPSEPERRPDAVSSIGVIHNGNSLSVTWSDALRANGYDIEYQSAGSTTWISAANDHTDRRLTISSGISPNRNYIVRVKAKNANGASGWTTSQLSRPPRQVPPTPPPSNRRRPAPPNPPPDAVSSIRVIHNGNTLSVSWSAATRATSYDIEYQNAGNATWRSAVTSHTGTSLTIGSDISPGQNYIVRVKAKNANGASDWATSAPANAPAASHARRRTPIARIAVVGFVVGAVILVVIAAWPGLQPGPSHVQTATPRQQEAAAPESTIENVPGAGSPDNVNKPNDVYSQPAPATPEPEAIATIQAPLTYTLPSPSSAQAQSAPPAAVPAPAAVDTSTMMVTHNGSSLSVSWDAPASANTYDVTYQSNGVDARAAWDRAGTTLTITCDIREEYVNQNCVDSGSSYSVGIRARNAGGASGWVYSTTVALAAPVAPTSTPPPTVASSTPAPVLTVLPATANPGETVGVKLTGFPPYTLVHDVSIQGFNILGDRTINTDANGDALVDNIVVPAIMDAGIHDVLATVGSMSAVVGQLAVVAIPPTPTPLPYPDPVLLAQRGPPPGHLSRAPGVGQNVSGCFVGDQTRQQYWIYLADRPSDTLESASNTILLEFRKTIPREELREVIPGECYYVGPVTYQTDESTKRCPGTVYNTACSMDDMHTGSFRMYVTEGTLREITEAPRFGN